jgi:serine/threonine protein kinase
MSLAPGIRVGVYEIIAAIGAGGMGEVYRARDRKLDRDVAIKILPRHSPVILNASLGSSVKPRRSPSSESARVAASRSPGP